MEKEKHYYTTGAFAKKAAVTIRTIRYYDKQGLLKPSHWSQAGYRLYTDEDFARLQKILALKYLGFSLEEIGAMTLYDTPENLRQSLDLQIGLIEKKREHLERVENALFHMRKAMEATNEVDWGQMLELIHLTNMERDLVEQYKTSANLKIRIGLHQRFSVNPEGWFPWLFSQIDLEGGRRILEVGCGNGELWKGKAAREALKRRASQFPDWQICLTDISEGMVEAAKKELEASCPRIFSYGALEAGKGDLGKFVRQAFGVGGLDALVANHMLFYIKDIPMALEEFCQALKKGGVLYASTYGKGHMKEVRDLAEEFDSRIRLSEVALYEKFGLENGGELLSQRFSSVEFRPYEDCLLVDSPEALADYILSCHGNQKEMLASRYGEFMAFLEEKISKEGAIPITKEAGVWVAKK